MELKNSNIKETLNGFEVEEDSVISYISNFKRNYNRKERLEILKQLPDAYEPEGNDPHKMSSSDLEKLGNVIYDVKEGKSFLKHLHKYREFSNPENLKFIYLSRKS